MEGVRMRRLCLTFILCCLLGGCASLGMPGTISETVSGFDGAKEITLEPAWLQSKGFLSVGDIKLGLYKTSRMEEDKAMLVVVVRGAKNFSSKESLKINIDGNITTYESDDILTNIETKGDFYWSSKRYLISKNLIKQLIEGKEVWVQVNLTMNYVEGEFSVDLPTTARPAFKKFYKKVWGE